MARTSNGHRQHRRLKSSRFFRAAVALMAMYGAFASWVLADDAAFADGTDAAAFSAYSSALDSISGDAYERCAVTAAGAAECWGYAPGGRLGDGQESVDRLSPVGVVGLSSGVRAISAGGSQVCALTEAGGAKCWGATPGDGSGYSTVPVDVVGLTSGVRSLSSGGDSSCFVTDSGSVKCFGGNSWGQLGDGTQSPSNTPVDVNGLGGPAVAVAVGSQNACALLTSGGVKCWGYEAWGTLGNGSWDLFSAVPVDVQGLHRGVVAITVGGGHACALLSTGAVKCWGTNGQGELGDGTSTGSNVPVGVQGLNSGVVSISAGTNSTCALLADRSVRCWGRNSEGALGIGQTGGPRFVPTAVVGLPGEAVAATVTGWGGCALIEDGSLYCWGYGASGQVGDGQGTPITVTPSRVIGFSGRTLGSTSLSPCAPDVTFDETTGDTVSRFTTTGACTWMVPTGVTSVTYLVVGGGGGGAVGGGGGGGVVSNADAETYTVMPGVTIAVTVGEGGGAGDGLSLAASRGGDSEFDAVRAFGGGAGGGVASVPIRASGG
ncbi:MAG: hypothetical protein F2934_13005, partial [Actinobacteria bacterium]|nr:hypothetical protein [Actinomycetota bacterium]